MGDRDRPAPVGCAAPPRARRLVPRRARPHRARPRARVRRPRLRLRPHAVGWRAPRCRPRAVRSPRAPAPGRLARWCRCHPRAVAHGGRLGARRARLGRRARARASRLDDRAEAVLGAARPGHGAVDHQCRTALRRRGRTPRPPGACARTKVRRRSSSRRWHATVPRRRPGVPRRRGADRPTLRSCSTRPRSSRRHRGARPGDARADRSPPASTKSLGRTAAVLAAELAAEHDLDTVALSGGVFQNARLTEVVEDELRRLGLEVLVHERVPPNDGGISVGQAAIARARPVRPGARDRPRLGPRRPRHRPVAVQAVPPGLGPRRPGRAATSCRRRRRGRPTSTSRGAPRRTGRLLLPGDVGMGPLRSSSASRSRPSPDRCGRSARRRRSGPGRAAGDEERGRRRPIWVDAAPRVLRLGADRRRLHARPGRGRLRVRRARRRPARGRSARSATGGRSGSVAGSTCW